MPIGAGLLHPPPVQESDQPHQKSAREEHDEDREPRVAFEQEVSIRCLDKITFSHPHDFRRKCSLTLTCSAAECSCRRGSSEFVLCNGYVLNDRRAKDDVEEAIGKWERSVLLKYDGIEAESLTSAL